MYKFRCSINNYKIIRFFQCFGSVFSTVTCLHEVGITFCAFPSIVSFTYISQMVLRYCLSRLISYIRNIHFFTYNIKLLTVTIRIKNWYSTIRYKKVKIYSKISVKDIPFHLILYYYTFYFIGHLNNLIPIKMILCGVTRLSFTF